MSALGMDANGFVRTAFEFKDIYERTGEISDKYYCPFCMVSYIDKCISTTCKKAPHFSLPNDTSHRGDCNGEVASADLAISKDSKIIGRTVIGDVDFPEALVAVCVFWSKSSTNSGRNNPLILVETIH